MEYIYNPVGIDQRFTFFIFYVYYSLKKLGREKFNFLLILEENILYESELLMEYQKGLNKGIIQAYRGNEEINIKELNELHREYSGIFCDLSCSINEKHFNEYFELYFKLLADDKLISNHTIFSTGTYYQSDDFEEKIKIKNFSKFSIQKKEFEQIISELGRSLGNNNIIIDIKDKKYIDMYIIDLIFLYYYKGYIDINMILFNTSICFDIGLLSKLLDLFEKEKILEENNFNEEDIIQIGKKIFYNKKSICLINDYKIYNIGKSGYELFLKTLLDNPGKICKGPDFKINNKKLKPTQKSSILDLVNDSYSYLKKTKLSFIIKYIIIYEGEGYEIKKHFN